MGKLPEKEGPPEIVYNEENAKKYDSCTRINQIQTEMTEKALDLLQLKDEGLVLDIGCGSGISGSVLTENNIPWIGIDISKEMLSIAHDKNESIGLIRGDIGNGLPFKPGTFSGVIGISVIQWLFEPYSNKNSPIQRIKMFFSTLYSICKNGSKCVFQFYTNDKKNIEILKKEALIAGFSGGIHIDKPNTKNVKKFLVLEVGVPVKKVQRKHKTSSTGKNKRHKR